MSKFRRKLKVVEAFQMTKECRWDDSPWPLWLQRAWRAKPGDGSVRPDLTADDESWGRLICGPEAFPRKINLGDWIIKSFRSDIPGCPVDIFSSHPDSFEADYEAISEDEMPTDAETALRAKLAGQVLCGLLAGWTVEDKTCELTEVYKSFAGTAVCLADALIDRLDDTATPPSK